MSEAELPSISIKTVVRDERQTLIPILEKSFEGWYVWHSKKTLRDIESVRGAFLEGEPVGLSMLKMLDDHNGYVYYVAVSPEMRGKKVGRRLLQDSVEYFMNRGAGEIFAGISEDNEESKGLFASQGFTQVSFSELSRRFGRLHAVNMYRKMVIVSGEVVYAKRLSKGLAPFSTKPD